jgi:hypothetical protein
VQPPVGEGSGPQATIRARQSAPRPRSFSVSSFLLMSSRPRRRDPGSFFAFPLGDLCIPISSPFKGEDEGEGPFTARDSLRARFKILPLPANASPKPVPLPLKKLPRDGTIEPRAYFERSDRTTVTDLPLVLRKRREQSER